MDKIKYGFYSHSIRDSLIYCNVEVTPILEIIGPRGKITMWGKDIDNQVEAIRSFMEWQNLYS